MKFISSIFLVFVLTLTLSAREKVNINFSDLEIKDFIKLISKVTHKNILFNHRITGSVNFISSTPVYDDELMSILISVLDSKGYTLVENGAIYEIVRASEAAKHNTKVLKENQSSHGSLMVTQPIKVEGENVDIVAAKIRYLISKTAKLMTLKESNTILVTDYPRNIQTIKKVIQTITQRKKNIVKIIEVKYADAKALQTQIGDIAKSIFNEKILENKVKILLDASKTNLILIGKAKNIAILEKLVKQFDKERSINNGVEIFKLKNSDAKNVLATLNAIIAKQQYKDKSLKPSLSMSEGINAIIAIGDPSVMRGVKLIIDELDQEKYQVYVQAKIIEISKTKLRDIGVKYGLSAGSVDSSGLYAMSANFGSASATSNALSAVSTYLGNIGTSKQALALGATLNFLETNGVSKSISNPSILCTNNKESSIYVGKTISVASGTTTGTAGTTSSYKREDVGLTLSIKPRVSSNDKVTLDVEAILENVTDDGSNNATGQPVTSKQKVKTQTILRHGEHIIIGGLVRTYDDIKRSKIPLLGDIPWIGAWLFSSKTKNKQQDNLVVILTPYIIGKSENLSKLQHDLGMLSRIQEEYNKEVFKIIKRKETE